MGFIIIIVRNTLKIRECSKIMRKERNESAECLKTFCGINVLFMRNKCYISGMKIFAFLVMVIYVSFTRKKIKVFSKDSFTSNSCRFPFNKTWKIVAEKQLD